VKNGAMSDSPFHSSVGAILEVQPLVDQSPIPTSFEGTLSENCAKNLYGQTIRFITTVFLLLSSPPQNRLDGLWI
jgi:hypothetical protein